MQVTLATPAAGTDLQPTPGTQPSKVHGSPSSHVAVSQSAVDGIVVVVGRCSVVVDDVVEG